MKDSLRVLTLTALLLAGCSSPYVLKLSNGTEVTAPSKPKLKGSYYYYKDAKGHQVQVPQSRVMSIEPASMAAEEKKFEVQNPKPNKHWWQFWK